MKPCVHDCGAVVLPIQISTHDCIEFLKSKLNFLVESNSELEQGLGKLHVDLNEIEAKNRRLRNETETLETRLEEVHVESVKIQTNYENLRLQLLLKKSVNPVKENAALENGNMDLVPTSSASHAILVAAVAVPVSVETQQPSPLKRARLDPPTPSAPKVRKYN
jgi:predicted nuclease with TOPRIM domain